jgi:PAS domain S-box-containing protein
MNLRDATLAPPEALAQRFDVLTADATEDACFLTAAGRPLRVLIVEDSADDAELMLLALRRGGLDPAWERVETADGLRTALAAGPWDAVLSGYALPGFGGPAALEVVRAADLDLPFIVVSETVGEDAAVTMMRAGANDYVRKHDITRLAPVIEREVRAAGNRRARRAAERRAAHLAAVVESSDDAIFSKTLDGVITSWNTAAERLYGWTAAEAIGQHVSFLVPPDKADELAGIMGRLRAGEQVEYFETVRLHRDGGRLDVSLTVSAVRDANGQVIGVSKIARDIRDRKRAEVALRASEERCRGLIESIPALVWVYDATGRPAQHNRRWYEYTGQVPDDAVADRWQEALHPDDVAGAVAAWERCKASGEPYTFEYRLRRADGVYRWFISKKTAVKGAGGIEQWVGVCTDIDDRKRAEEESRQTTALLRAVAEGTTDAVYVKDREGKYLLINEAAARFVGRSVAEVLGKDDTTLFDPIGARRVMAQGRSVMASGRAEMSEEVLTAAGVTRTYQTMQVPHRDAAGNVIGIIGIARDITERRRLAVERDELLARLQLHIERMPLAYILFDADLRITDWNPAAGRILGYTRAEAIGMRPFDLIPPSSRQMAAELLARIRAGDMAANSVNENLTKDGRTITCEWLNTPLTSEGGQFVGMLCLAQDISARREAEVALRLRDRAIQAVTQGILITDPGQPDNPIVYASPGFLRLTGYEAEEVLGRNCRFLQGKDTDPAAVARVREAVRDGGPCSVELLNYRKDGAPFWNELSISPILDAAGRLTHFVGAQADVTARRSLEEQLRQAQKMEAVGQLAGGVAHDFNNLLCIINGYSDLLLENLPPGDPSRGSISEILKAGQRSAGLTRQLLAFSRQQVLAPRVLDLNEVVTDTDKMLRRVIGEDVRLTSTLGPELWAVRADPGQVEQVLMNLAVNARDAMPQGGRLTIETRNVELDESYARAHPDARAGPHVLLSVTDTGSGMPPDVKARIFEPFFTTKGPGKGTGLGLATVYGIVKQSGGHVAVSSEVGVGTTFQVYLPRAEPAAGGPKVRPPGPQAPPRGTETVLLVEDEGGVRALTRHVLAGCGYTVLEAADGDEAVRVAAGHDGPIHVLVTDVVMPGAGGPSPSRWPGGTRGCGCCSCPGTRTTRSSGTGCSGRK